MPGSHYYMKPKKKKAEKTASATPTKPKRTFTKRASVKSRMKTRRA